MSGVPLNSGTVVKSLSQNHLGYVGRPGNVGAASRFGIGTKSLWGGTLAEFVVSHLRPFPAVPQFAAMIVLAAVAVYSNSFRGLFVYDDLPAILENPTIRQSWSVWQALVPPAHATVSGRPLLNLSLAANYALGGSNPWSYHLVNLAVHVFAALLLFGILRRTFLLPVLRDRLGPAATGLAASIALVWAIHPLQTESVTYIVQRAESLCGLFYLLTLYCVIRGAASVRDWGLGIRDCKEPCSPSTNCQSLIPNPFLWYSAAVLACLLGMAAKEIMVTAPLVVLLYDRTFLAGTLGRALRRRWGLYLGLVATWGLLAFLMLSLRLHGHGNLGTTATSDFWSYLRTQPGVLLHYLGLCFCPRQLCLDYAWPVATRLGQILPGLLVVGLLASATLAACVGSKTWGFLGACFLLILAPTSSILPLADPAAEHRMYLPLAAVLTAAVLGAYGLGIAFTRIWPGTSRAVNGLGGCLLVVIAFALGTLTYQRNQDYRSPLSIWQDTVAKAPDNARAHNNLGAILFFQHRKVDEAIAHYRKALELVPQYDLAHDNLGNALWHLGKNEEAVFHYQQALQINPRLADVYNNYGLLLQGQGRIAEAVACYCKTLELQPYFGEAYANLGNVCYGQGRFDDAITYYRKALEVKPRQASAHYNLGVALTRRGKTDEAITHYVRALEIDPGFQRASGKLSALMQQRGQSLASLTH